MIVICAVLLFCRSAPRRSRGLYCAAVLLLCCSTALLLACSPARAEVVFTPAAGADTGLNQIVADWLALIPADPWVWGATAIDYDGDGDSDIALTTHRSGIAGFPTTIICKNHFIETGQITFTNVTHDVFSSIATLPSNSPPHVWDADGDGDLDLIQGYIGGTLRNDGGVFTHVIDSILAYERNWVGIADLNGDGRLDLWRLIPSKGTNTRRVWINDGDCTFTHLTAPLAQPAGLPQVVADRLAETVATTQSNVGPKYIERDFNGDGRVDLMVSVEGGYTIEGYAYLCLHDENGDLQEASAAAGLPIEQIEILGVEDVTNDGRLDLLICPGGARAGLWIQAADGTYSNAANPAITQFLSNADPYFPLVRYEDFDLDGNLDFSIQRPRSQRGAVFANNGDGTFTELINATAWVEGMYVRSLAGVPADFNADGLTDVLIAGLASGKKIVTLYVNTSAPVDPPDDAPSPDDPPDDPPTRDSTTTPVIGGQKIVLPGNQIRIEVEQPPARPVDPEPDPPVDPDPDPPAEPEAALALPPHDVSSIAWLKFKALVDKDLATPQYAITAYEHALVYAVTGDERHSAKAIRDVDQHVRDAEAVIAAGGRPVIAGDQYLYVGAYLQRLAATYAWCPVPNDMKARWAAYAEQALHNVWNPTTMRWGDNPTHMRGGVGLAGPSNNYKFGQMRATMYWALASGSEQWLTFLNKGFSTPGHRNDIFGYQANHTGGGSPEGTGYGEAIRSVLELAILWRDSRQGDQETRRQGAGVKQSAPLLVSPASPLLGHCPNWTIQYWAHATTPGFKEKCPIGDQTRIYGLDAYHRHIMRLCLDLVEPDSPEAAIARWWIATSKIPVTRFELSDLPPGDAAPPSELTYYAAGVGHFFSRTSWDSGATLLYVIAGPLHGGHAHEEHGNFGVWQDGWRTVTQSRWSNSGTAGDTPFHNVVRFEQDGVPILQSAQGATTLLEYEDSSQRLTLDLDLSAAYTTVLGTAKPRPVFRWERQIEWDKAANRFTIDDQWDVGDGVQAFEQLQAPSATALKLLEPAGQTWESWLTIQPKAHQGGWRMSAEHVSRLVFEVEG